MMLRATTTCYVSRARSIVVPAAPAHVVPCRIKPQRASGPALRKHLLAPCKAAEPEVSTEQDNELRAAAAAAAAEFEKAIKEYTELLESGAPPKDFDAFRRRCNFRRGPDGRVIAIGRNNEYDVRLDMLEPGSVLLRDHVQNTVYGLVTDLVTQVDLTEDLIVLQLFMNPAYEDALIPVMMDPSVVDGKEDVKMEIPPMEFRSFKGLGEVSENLAGWAEAYMNEMVRRLQEAQDEEEAKAGQQGQQ